MAPTSLLHYTDTGSGMPVILIHGFCESNAFWKDFAGHLSPRFRVIAIDLPGFGESPLKKKDITIEYMADRVHDVVKHLNIDQCVMIGHSLGGYVTLAFAEKYEDKLKGIGLFHSTVFADSPEKRKNRNKTAEFVEKHGSAVFAESFVPSLFYEPNLEKFKDTVTWLKTIAASTPAEGIIAATKAMRDRKGRTEVLKNIKVPVLFIIGEEDKAVPLDASLEMASFPSKSVKHILADTGHMGMFEKKEETLKIVEDFLGLL